MIEEQKKFYNTDMSEYSYYHNEFAFWIDLRSTQDNKNLHGTDLRLANTEDRIQLNMTTRTLCDNYKAYVFIVADAPLNSRNNQLDSVVTF